MQLILPIDSCPLRSKSDQNTVPPRNGAKCQTATSAWTFDHPIGPNCLSTDADWIRALAARKGALANIPPRCNRSEPICFSPYLYRARNLVERFFNKIKHCRRVATRYDKLAANYFAFVQLASIRLWLRVNESAS